MYAKLIFRNAKRSAKDYLVSIITMTLCVMLFYAFQQSELSNLKFCIQTLSPKLQSMFCVKTNTTTTLLLCVAGLFFCHHSYPQFLHLNCLPGFLLAQPHIATSTNFAFFNRGEFVYEN